MAERLTRNNKVNFYFHDEASNMVYYKLQKLEDIMVKYGIESVEKLSNALEFAKVIENILSEYGIKDNEELDKKLADGITWQKACELACRHIAEVEWLSCPETDDISESENEIKTLTKQSLNYFYQQAKKEGNDERKN